MSKKILTSLDMVGNQLLGARIENLASLPAFGSAGRFVFNTTNLTMHYDTGTAWTAIGAGSITLAAITDMTAFGRSWGAAADASGGRTLLNLDALYAPLAHSHGDADITGLAATKLTGTIDIARLPVLPGTVQIVSSLDIAALTVPQQNEIGDGSIVTTTDGRRWVYTGAGSKVLEASYIQLADITPDWATIANKPTFLSKFSATGPGTAGFTWAINHGLNTSDISVTVVEVATGAEVIIDNVRTSANVVTLTSDSAQMGINSLRATIIG